MRRGTLYGTDFCNLPAQQEACIFDESRRSGNTNVEQNQHLKMKTVISKLAGFSTVALVPGLTACTEENGNNAALREHAEHAAAQTHCPVAGEELGSMGDPVVVTHEGKELKLCCDSCIEKFEADPAKYAAKVH